MDDFELIQPQKTFYYYLTGSLFIRPFQLYGQYWNIVEKQIESLNPSLYFVAENSKIRYELEKTVVKKNGTLEIAFQVANSKLVKTQITLPELLYDDLPNDFKSTIIGTKDYLDYLKTLWKKDYQQYSAISLDYNESDNTQLVLNLFTPTFSAKIPLPAHTVAFRAMKKIEGFPKILYIGQSNKIKQRTFAHEKIQKALAEVNDSKDIYIYFFDFTSKTIMTSLPWEEMKPALDDPKVNINKKSRLNLVEMILINYFKPKYNKVFTRSNVEANMQVKKSLRANKFTQITIESSFDSDFWCFGSDVISFKKDHLITYQLDNPFLEMNY